MKRFILEGEFIKKGKRFKFKKEISAPTKGFAKEKLFCILGSCHRIERRFINIKNIEVLPNARKVGVESSPDSNLN